MISCASRVTTGCCHRGPGRFRPRRPTLSTIASSPPPPPPLGWYAATTTLPSDTRRASTTARALPIPRSSTYYFPSGWSPSSPPGRRVQYRFYRITPSCHSSPSDNNNSTTKNATSGTSTTTNESTVIYSTEALTKDAAKHKAGLDDVEIPSWQNPLHHDHPELAKQFEEDFASPEEFEAAVLPVPPMQIDGRVAAPEQLQALADEILQLNMLELNELVNKMAEQFGFSEDTLMPPDDAAGEADVVEDDEDANDAAVAVAAAKTTFDVKLLAFDDKAKIKIIKEVRAIATLGLKEAKEMVEAVPKVIMKDIKKEDADAIKTKLEELGATIEIV